MSTRTRALFVTGLAAALLRDHIGLSAPEVRNDNRRSAEPVVASPSLPPAPTADLADAEPGRFLPERRR